MKICKVCKTVVEDQVHYCPRCGATDYADFQTKNCNFCRSVVAVGTIVCPQCHKILPPEKGEIDYGYQTQQKPVQTYGQPSQQLGATVQPTYQQPISNQPPVTYIQSFYTQAPQPQQPQNGMPSQNGISQDSFEALQQMQKNNEFAMRERVSAPVEDMAKVDESIRNIPQTPTELLNRKAEIVRNDNIGVEETNERILKADEFAKNFNGNNIEPMVVVASARELRKQAKIDSKDNLKREKQEELERKIESANNARENNLRAIAEKENLAIKLDAEKRERIMATEHLEMRLDAEKNERKLVNENLELKIEAEQLERKLAQETAENKMFNKTINQINESNELEQANQVLNKQKAPNIRRESIGGNGKPALAIGINLILMIGGLVASFLMVYIGFLNNAITGGEVFVAYLPDMFSELFPSDFVSIAIHGVMSDVGKIAYKALPYIVMITYVASLASIVCSILGFIYSKTIRTLVLICNIVIVEMCIISLAIIIIVFNLATVGTGLLVLTATSGIATLVTILGYKEKN